MAAAGLEEVERYVVRHQNTIAKYIATRLILEPCLQAEQKSEDQVARR